MLQGAALIAVLNTAKQHQSHMENQIKNNNNTNLFGCASLRERYTHIDVLSEILVHSNSTVQN